MSIILLTGHPALTLFATTLCGGLGYLQGWVCPADGLAWAWMPGIWSEGM